MMFYFTGIWMEVFRERGEERKGEERDKGKSF